ncbi:hypothetical protein FOA52_004342 [Chlamydomonas sp. UWO 241]|nr:hypothetical protein FOA52_004342 [Chlamydomonas sp. UWO 241]
MGVADYVLDGVIGQGQFGVAHKSRNIKDGKQYCIKKINSIAKDDQASTLKEAQLLSTLEHPNIIRYKECYIDPSDGSLCIVTSFCEEGELHRRIRLRAKTNQFYKEDEVMDMFIQIASALMYIHSKKILHRDLKTQNIFIARGGIMVLGDFGIAKVLEKTDQFATTVTGTPYYMAPEICSSQPYTFKSDIWSLGCVLYELCTLKHAFAADSLLSLVYQIVRGDYPPIPSDMFSAGLSNLITVLLARQPNERPSLQQVFQIPYVKKHLARYHAEQKLQVERQTNNVARRRMASAPVGVDQVLSPGQSIDAGMEGLTPRQQMARRKELHNQQRELELQMASMAAGDSRAQVLERKQRMIQSHFQQGMVPTRPGALIEPVREEPIRYPDVDAMFNGGDSVLLGSVVMGANGFNDSLVVGSNVAAANDALHAGLTSADGQRPTSTREAHARPSPPTAAPAGPARPNGAAGPGARPRPGQPGFTKAMADRMGAVQQRQGRARATQESANNNNNNNDDDDDDDSSNNNDDDDDDDDNDSNNDNDDDDNSNNNNNNNKKKKKKKNDYN